MTVAVTTYVAALTQTSAVVATAFSTTPVPLVLNPDPAVAYSTVSGGNFAGRNILPVTATAVVQQSNTVTPPGPAAQLTFFWG